MAIKDIGEGLGAGRRAGADVIKEFKTFILRGNVIDLAVGVVVGVAFTAVVTALVKDVITPLIAAIGARPDFSALSVTVNRSHILYGDFINALVSFLIVATVIFFMVVMPMNRLVRLTKRSATPPAPTTRDCTECLSKIPMAARRCPFCTSEQVPAAPAASR